MRRRARPPSASPPRPRTSSGSAYDPAAQPRRVAPGSGDVVASAAYEAAVRYLAPRPRAVVEVRRHLLKKRYAAAEVDAAIRRTRDEGYLDDAAFARYWLEQRARFRPKGPLALRAELRAKGLEAAVIDAALSEADGTDEIQAARAALAPRLARWRDLDRAERKAKAQALLRQRGFSFDAIEEVLTSLD